MGRGDAYGKGFSRAGKISCTAMLLHHHRRQHFPIELPAEPPELCESMPIGSIHKIVVFALSITLAVILGGTVELVAGDLFLYARELHQAMGGKPLPSVTQWVFDVFGNSSHGGIFCLFQLPAGLFLFYSLLDRRGGATSDMRLILGLGCFLICEAILFVVFAFVCLLPFIPHYLRNPPEAPPSAYILHLLLAIVIIAVLVAGCRKMVSQGETGTGHQS
jgi:hypothetical protein